MKSRRAERNSLLVRCLAQRQLTYSYFPFIFGVQINTSEFLELRWKIQRLCWNTFHSNNVWSGVILSNWDFFFFCNKKLHQTQTKPKTWSAVNFHLLFVLNWIQRIDWAWSNKVHFSEDISPGLHINLKAQAIRNGRFGKIGYLEKCEHAICFFCVLWTFFISHCASQGRSQNVCCGLLWTD